eukprot:m.87952 g.87952  ORF g.87952 m.87952 type:complete len:144 (+) comp14521_c1_seq2:325-756(+)
MLFTHNVLFSLSQLLHFPVCGTARVFELVRRVPPGKVTTYGRVAAALHCGSARAIGQAMRHNPYGQSRYQPPYPAQMVPCHRVIASDLSLGGFSGQTDPTSKELCNKVKFLRQEGVKFSEKGGKLYVAEESVITPSLDDKVKN